METFRFKVVLTVDVEAFDETDAIDHIQETFGVGEELGANVIECEYEPLG